MLQALILRLLFFTCLVLLMSITPSPKSKTNNSFRIMTVIVVIIKANIINIKIKKIHLIAKNVMLSESQLKKDYIIISI